MAETFKQLTLVHVIVDLQLTYLIKYMKESTFYSLIEIIKL